VRKVVDVFWRRETLSHEFWRQMGDIVADDLEGKQDSRVQTRDMPNPRAPTRGKE